jgi:hypothetical protein
MKSNPRDTKNKKSDRFAVTLYCRKYPSMLRSIDFTIKALEPLFTVPVVSLRDTTNPQDTDYGRLCLVISREELECYFINAGEGVLRRDYGIDHISWRKNEERIKVRYDKKSTTKKIHRKIHR